NFQSTRNERFVAGRSSDEPYAIRYHKGYGSFRKEAFSLIGEKLIIPCFMWQTKPSRSFTRKWLLPENVDLEAIRTQLDDKGHLSVEAPKSIEGQTQKRSIPIMAAPKN
ncbi:hypothetical protein COOONC_22070, partial [Cooperia oncophora]